jgi:DNA-binding response OmpR family regulator
MHDWEARAKLLETENDALRARNEQLEEQLGLCAEPRLVFGLTKNESIMFRVLLNNKSPRKETCMTALFADRIDDPPEIKIIDVWISHMRKKLKPFGVEINTTVGVGYEMLEASKARARELMG